MGTMLTKVECEGPWDFLAKYAMRCTKKVSNGIWATIFWTYWHFMSFIIMVHWKIGYVCSAREPEPSSSFHLWLQTNSLCLTLLSTLKFEVQIFNCLNLMRGSFNFQPRMAQCGSFIFVLIKFLALFHKNLVEMVIIIIIQLLQPDFICKIANVHLNLI